MPTKEKEAGAVGGDEMTVRSSQGEHRRDSDQRSPTERERLLLRILAGEDTPRSIPVLQYRHVELRPCKPMSLASDMKNLIASGLVTRIVGGSGNETRYRITSDGHQKLILA